MRKEGRSGRMGEKVRKVHSKKGDRESTKREDKT